MTKSWDYNIHSHTFRCGHAAGEDEEYVLACRKAGFPYMGFSDHVFLPGVHDPRIRGDASMLEDYTSSVNSLKEKYKKDMKIYLGFEAEYLEDFLPYYQKLLEEKIIDYLILGQHCYFKDGTTHWYSRGVSCEEAVNNYVDDVIKGMHSGLFTYVAHPDFFMIFDHAFKTCHEEASKRLIKEAKALHVPFEINMAHSRRYGDDFDPESRMVYPFPPFWKMVSEIGAEVVLGVDAHRPEEYLLTPYDYFENFVKELNLNLIRHCPLDR